MAKKVVKKKKKSVDNKKPKISLEYTEDFNEKIKNLQNHFTGENRRILYDKLKKKGVITNHYSVDTWNNDLKAWKRNPNNGIFNRLEMIGAILDEANMPAFEVFGGPHARDTDEIIKVLNTNIINCLKKYLAPFRKKRIRSESKRERVINGKEFENAYLIYNLIQENFCSWYPKNPKQTKYQPFFFLYAWPEKSQELLKYGTDKLLKVIQNIANHCINGFYSSYYYSYYFQPFSDKIILPKFNNFHNILYYHDDLLNYLLMISYQLNCINQLYNLYNNKKKVSYTKKNEDTLLYQTHRFSDTGEEIDDLSFAPCNDISKINERIYASLRLNDNEMSGKERNENFLHQIDEIIKTIENIVNIIIKINSQNYSEIFKAKEQLNFIMIDICNIFPKFIINFQELIWFLLNPNIDNVKPCIQYYKIDTKIHKPIKIIKVSYIFTVTNPLLDMLKDCNLNLKYIENKILN